ncbi:MAG: SPOR domain-containing protein [Rikenellaceae bacterium]
MKFYNSDINALVAEAIINCKELSLGHIGTLSCRIVGAIENSDGTITPPKNIIELKKDVQNPQNNIIDLISAAYSINKEEAKEVSETWLKNLSKTDEDGVTRYTIFGVGEFIVSNHNSVVFKCDNKLINDLNFLNKDSIQQSESTNAPIEELIPETISSELPNLDEFMPSKKDETPEIETTTNDKKENEMKSEPTKVEPVINNSTNSDKPEGNNQLGKKIALIIVILFMLSTIGVLVYKNQQKPIEVIREITVEKVVVDTVYIEKPEVIELISNGKYQVICGAFDIKENGEKCLTRFKARGYSPYMQYIENKGLYFVSLGGYTELREAQEALNEVVLKVYEEDGYWIYNSNNP